MFFHHLINKEETSIARKVLEELIKSSKKGDFVNQIKIDLKTCNTMLAFEEIANQSKNEMKRIAKSACRKACFDELINIKNNKSKGEQLVYKSFETQSYFNPEKKFPLKT